MWARIHLIPVLQAEEDRDQVRRMLADKAREKELLGSETKVYHSDRWGSSNLTLITSRILMLQLDSSDQHSPLHLATSRNRVLVMSGAVSGITITKKSPDSAPGTIGKSVGGVGSLRRGEQKSPAPVYILDVMYRRKTDGVFITNHNEVIKSLASLRDYKLSRTTSSDEPCYPIALANYAYQFREKVRSLLR